MSVCHDEVYPSDLKVENDSADYEGPDCKPGDNWDVCIKIVLTKRLLPYAQMQTFLVFGDLIGDDIPLSLNGPHIGKDISIIGH